MYVFKLESNSETIILLELWSDKINFSTPFESLSIAIPKGEKKSGFGKVISEIFRIVSDMFVTSHALHTAVVNSQTLSRGSI